MERWLAPVARRLGCGELQQLRTSAAPSFAVKWRGAVLRASLIGLRLCTAYSDVFVTSDCQRGETARGVADSLMSNEVRGWRRSRRGAGLCQTLDAERPREERRDEPEWLPLTSCNTQLEGVKKNVCFVGVPLQTNTAMTRRERLSVGSWAQGPRRASVITLNEQCSQFSSSIVPAYTPRRKSKN